MWLVFFFEQKTAYEVRISDWSSDVCSSDLPPKTVMTDNEDEVTRGAPALVIVPEWHSQRLARDLDARAEEARGLALAIGLDVVAVHTLRLRQTRAATLLGVGQIDAIAPDIAAKGVQLVVVDAALSPIQPRSEKHKAELQTQMR